MRTKKVLQLFLILIMLLAITSCNANNTNPVNEEIPTSLSEPTVLVETAEPVEPVKTDDIKPMKIGEGVTLNYLGRSSVRLDFYDGRVVYIDPAFGSKDDYLKEADIILVTHQHTDHNNVKLVTLKEDGKIIQCPKNIKSGKLVEVGDIKIEAVDAYNSNHSKRSCCGFIITWNDLVIYHSGDTSTTKQMESFPDYEIDYAMLCMDGFYNMGTEEAAEVANLIKAQAVIPIHTASHGAYNIYTAKEFSHPSRLIVDVGESLDLYNLSETDGVGVPLDQAIVNIMDDRLAAIENEDYDLFTSVITRNNQFLFNEQERWFVNMIDESIHDVSFEIVSTEMIDSHTGVVNIRQQHQTTESFDFEYPLLFKYEYGKWMDYGYNFIVSETDRFYVKYMEGETRVDEFTKMLDDAFDNLDKIYDLKPVDGYEMKLFNDQEILRQCSIPAKSWLFTGWAEPDESLKLYTGHPREFNGYPGVVQHELVHHITIRMCNNNLPLWLLEGIAMYDGTAYYGFETSRLLSSMKKNHVSLTLDYIEKHDLNTDLSTEEVYCFYNTSYMYTRYICETYGHETLMDLFREAGKKPFHDSTLNDTFEQENQKTAKEVIAKVLGLTKAELSANYLKWLDEVDFENLG